MTTPKLSKVKKFILGLVLLPSLVFADNWDTNDDGYVFKEAEETNDFMGINPCTQNILFIAPTKDQVDGPKGKLAPQMRIDTESAWQGEVQAFVKDNMYMVMIQLTPEFLAELVGGKYLRIKWADKVYSRFDLNGLTAKLKEVKCDSIYFQEKKDSDYFT